MFQPRLWFLAAMVAYAVLARVIPYVLYQFGMHIDPAMTIYPWNFSPLSAICLFGAAHFAERRWAYLVPIGALLVSDLLIGMLAGDLNFAVYADQPVIYGAFVLTTTLGLWLRKHTSVLSIAGTAVVAEVLFFLVTNLSTWATGTMYPHTAAGLLACYVAAIPFFGRSLLSTAVFATVLFSRLALRRPSLATLQPAVAVGQ